MLIICTCAGEDTQFVRSESRLRGFETYRVRCCVLYSDRLNNSLRSLDNSQWNVDESYFDLGVTRKDNRIIHWEREIELLDSMPNASPVASVTVSFQCYVQQAETKRAYLL